MLRYVNRLSVLLARVAGYRNDLVALLGFRHELYLHGCQSPASSLSRQRPARPPSVSYDWLGCAIQDRVVALWANLIWASSATGQNKVSNRGSMWSVYTAPLDLCG